MKWAFRHPAVLVVLAAALLVTPIMWFVMRDPDEVVQEKAQEVVDEATTDFVERSELQRILAETRLDTIRPEFPVDATPEQTAAYWRGEFTRVLLGVENNRELMAYIATRQDEVLANVLIILCRDPVASERLGSCNPEVK